MAMVSFFVPDHGEMGLFSLASSQRPDRRSTLGPLGAVPRPRILEFLVACGSQRCCRVMVPRLLEELIINTEKLFRTMLDTPKRAA